MIRPDFSIPETVIIAHNIHCLSEQGFNNVMEFAKDYDVKDCMKDKSHPHEGYWLSLKDKVRQRVVKCNFCKNYNPVCGCKVHGFTCFRCAEVLYREYLPDAPVIFRFVDDKYYAKVALKIHSYEDYHLICYPDYLECSRGIYSLDTEEKTREHFEKYKDAYTEVEIDGKKLLSFYYPPSHSRSYNEEKVKISVDHVGWPEDSTVKKCHYEEVTLYKGEEYPQNMGLPFTERLPVPDSFMAYKTFEKDKTPDKNLTRRILYAAGQTARCNYYGYDGRDYFTEGNLKWIRDYIQHFTTLNVQKFEKFLEICRKDGPGFLVHLADWIGNETGIPQLLDDRPYDLKEFMRNIHYRSNSYMTKEEREAYKKIKPKFMRNFMGYDYMELWIEE